MTEQGQDAITGKRLYWLDNLRTFMIFLVIVFHASVVYDKYAIGTDWWIVIDPSMNDLPGILNLLIDIFVMPTIFFIAGCVTLLSLKNKNGWAFLKSKFQRLIIPLSASNSFCKLVPLFFQNRTAGTTECQHYDTFFEYL